MYKGIFEFHEGPRQAINITYLMDGDRKLTTQQELETHILAFYKQLYTRDNTMEEAEEAREDCLQYLT